MNASYLSFKETGIFPRLICDYLDGNEQTRYFYKYPPSFDIIPRIIEEKQIQDIDRQLLVSVFNELYEAFGQSDAVKKNIALLEKESTFTVTTAHQPCLMTGPLYFIVKIADTIRLSEELKQRYPDNDFVPVYWMGSEDHDFEEINHLFIHRQRVEWNKDASGPVGRLKLKGIDTVIDHIAEILGDSIWANEWVEILKKHYRADRTLAEATFGLVNELFASYGLLVITGDRKDLKERFLPIMKRELLERKSREAVEKKIRLMEENGYKAQAHAREINLFYFNDGIRERIEYQPGDDSFEVLNTHLYFDRETMISELDKCPNNFSPNVILRPVYQECILPNLAYVGGAGEISYWMELKAVFELYHINFPLLLVRNSVMILEEKAQKKIEKLHLELQQLFEEEEQLIRSLVMQRSGGLITLEEEKSEIRRIMERVKESALQIDPTLGRSVEGEKQKIFKSLDKLEGKMLRAEKKKHEIMIRQIRALKEQVLPGGKLHERVDNIAGYYAKYGPTFLQEMQTALQPIDKQLIALSV